MRIKIKKKCKRCKKEYYVVPSQKDRSKYCSMKCRMDSLNSFLIKNATNEEKKERYISSFEKHVVRKNGCWEWTGFKNKLGYAIMTCNSKIGPSKAHRGSWIIHNGSIPKGKIIRHLCNNPTCTNPEHLAVGTMKDNSRDCIESNRICRGEKSPFAKLTEENVVEIKKKLRKDKLTCKEISKEFNVSSACISAINVKRNWKHITLEE